jgi:hypothetical protein
MEFKGTGVLPVPFFFAKFWQRGLSRAARNFAAHSGNWPEKLYERT